MGGGVMDEAQLLEGASWRLAGSLKVLLAECNTYAPHRSKARDGTIGDAAHAARASRHNPYNGVVTALDITHDPAGGMDTYAVARDLVTHPHPDLCYIISDRQVASRAGGWAWKVYQGADPHTEHMHIAVGVGPDSAPMPPYDDVTPWGVGQGDDMNDLQDKLLKLARVSDVARSADMDIIKALIAGDKTTAAILEAQKVTAVAAEKVRLGV